MAHKEDKQDETRLQDLDVREVSVVDRPANQRKFLVVKRENQATICMEEEMSGIAEQTGIENADTLDLLFDDDVEITVTAKAADEDDQGLEEIDKTEDDDSAADPVEPDTEDPPADDTPEDNPEPETTGLTAIFKAGMVRDALPAVQRALRMLTGAVNAMKGLGEKPVTPPILNQLKALAEGLAMLAGAEEQRAEKVDTGMLQAATGALEKLMETYNKLKGLNGEDPLPDGIKGALKSVSGTLASLLGSQQQAQEPEKEDKDEKGTTAKAETTDDPADREVIIKVGSKMKKTRLSVLRTVVDKLQDLLKDLEGEPTTDQTQKTEDPPTPKETPDLAEKLTKAFEEMDKKITDQLSPLVEKLDTITKRVETLETENPGGNGSVDPEEIPVEKSNKSLWGNIFK